MAERTEKYKIFNIKNKCNIHIIQLKRDAYPYERQYLFKSFKKQKGLFILSHWEMRKAEGQEESKELRYPDLQPFGCWLLSAVSLRLP